MGADRITNWIDVEQLSERVSEGIALVTKTFVLMKEAVEAFTEAIWKAWELLREWVRAFALGLVQSYGRRRFYTRSVRRRFNERKRWQRQVQYQNPLLAVRRRSERCLIRGMR